MLTVHKSILDVLSRTGDHGQSNSQSLDTDLTLYPTGDAGRLYAERRRRESWFGEQLFWEPSWDILLYLYDAQDAGVSSVSLDRLLRAEFALSKDSIDRWVALLAEKKLIEVKMINGSPIIGLSARGRMSMEGYLEEGRSLAAL